MKKLNIILLIIMALGFGMQASAATQSATDKKPAHKLLAAACPKGCSSCWDQCTTSSACGTGHKCVASACGNRCTKE